MSIDETETTVTMVGKSYAKKGFKFYFKAPRLDICPKTCRFLNPCMMNLKKGKIYVVLENMGIEHECPSDYHEEPMNLVKVRESDILILLESRSTFLGAVTTYKPQDCPHKDCEFLGYCTPIRGLRPGTRVKIVEIVKKIKDNKCGLNLSLVRVEKVNKN